MPVIHTRGGDDRRKASSYRRAFGGIVSGNIFIGQQAYAKCGSFIMTHYR